MNHIVSMSKSKNKIQRIVKFEKTKRIFAIDDIYNEMMEINPKLKAKGYTRDDIHYFLSVFGEELSKVLVSDSKITELPMGLGDLQVVATQSQVSNYKTEKKFDNLHSFGFRFFLKYYSGTAAKKNLIRNIKLYKIKTFDTLRENLTTNVKKGLIYNQKSNEKVIKDG